MFIFPYSFYNNMTAHCSQVFLLCFSSSVLCLFTSLISKANSEKNIVYELLKQGCERLQNQTQFFLQTDFMTPLLNGYRFCSITTQKSPLGLEVERKNLWLRLSLIAPIFVSINTKVSPQV